jgi:hypothetical protein
MVHGTGRKVKDKIPIPPAAPTCPVEARWSEDGSPWGEGGSPGP